MNSSEYVIYMFGGVRPASRLLNKAPSSICGWNKRGTIPSSSHTKILSVAKKLKIDIKPKDLIYGRTVKIKEKR